MQCMRVVCVYVCGLVCMPMCRSRSHRMVLHSCSLTLYTIAQKQGLSLSPELGWHLACRSEFSCFFHFIMLGYRHSHTWLFPLVLGFEIRSSHLCSHLRIYAFLATQTFPQPLFVKFLFPASKPSHLLSPAFDPLHLFS